MINNIISRFNFNQESKDYSSYCNNSFRLGYLIGCIYTNHEIEMKFDILEFQYVDTRAVKGIQNKFFELLKKSGIKDDKSGIVLSYLSMIEGLKSGLKNEIRELAKDWDNERSYCNELFLSKFHIDIKNEYLALCDDKAAFLILRQNEFELHQKYADDVESRIKKRQDLLNQQDKKIIKFTFEIAQELQTKILRSLKFLYSDKFLLLKISSLVMFYTRVITTSGSFKINEKLIKEFTNIIEFSPHKFDVAEVESFEINFNGYLGFSLNISYVLKHLKKDVNENLITTEKNNFTLVEDFNKLISDDGYIKLEKDNVLTILSYLDTRVREFNL